MGVSVEVSPGEWGEVGRGVRRDCHDLQAGGSGGRTTPVDLERVDGLGMVLGSSDRTLLMGLVSGRGEGEREREPSRMMAVPSLGYLKVGEASY